MQIICNLSNFDLKSFINETIEGRKCVFEPDTDEGANDFRVICQDDYENHELTVRPGRDIEEELVKHHYKIFFPFANYSKNKYTFGGYRQSISLG